VATAPALADRIVLDSKHSRLAVGGRAQGRRLCIGPLPLSVGGRISGRRRAARRPRPRSLYGVLAAGVSNPAAVCEPHPFPHAECGPQGSPPRLPDRARCRRRLRRPTRGRACAPRARARARRPARSRPRTRGTAGRWARPPARGTPHLGRLGERAERAGRQDHCIGVLQKGCRRTGPLPNATGCAARRPAVGCIAPDACAPHPPNITAGYAATRWRRPPRAPARAGGARAALMSARSTLHPFRRPARAVLSPRARRARSYLRIVRTPGGRPLMATPGYSEGACVPCATAAHRTLHQGAAADVALKLPAAAEQRPLRKRAQAAAPFGAALARGLRAPDPQQGPQPLAPAACRTRRTRDQAAEPFPRYRK
jgi:hypothetical protein